MNIFKRIWDWVWRLCYSESYDDWKRLVKEKEAGIWKELINISCPWCEAIGENVKVYIKNNGTWDWECLRCGCIWSISKKEINKILNEEKQNG